jgi:hypothetical protein
MYVVVNPDRKSDVLRRAVYALDLNMGLAFMNWQQRLKDMAARVAAKKIEVRAGVRTDMRGKSETCVGMCGTT